MGSRGKSSNRGGLTYGSLDSSLSSEQRRKVEAWEARRIKNKIEYAFSVDADGNVIGEARGGKGSVRHSEEFLKEGAVFTHVHPRTNEWAGTTDLIGGTFSYDDLHNFAKYKVGTMRAITKEGAYSISKTKNFNSKGFERYVLSANNAYDKRIDEGYKKLNAKWQDGKMNFTAYVDSLHKMQNKELSRLHNVYKQGQKEYGYTYTLERR